MNITKEEIRKEVKKHFNKSKDALVFKNNDKEELYTTSSGDVVEHVVEFICKCLNLKENR